MKIGLTLSGGVARGIAHIGAIKALRENDIEIDCVSGSSAGSIVAALYASNVSTEGMLEFVKNASLYRIFKIALPKMGITNLNYLKEKLEAFIEEDHFEALPKKLYLAVSNLNTGKCEYLNSGSVINSVLASCSLPFLFSPIEIGESIYVDGGLLDNFPVKPLIEIEKVNVLLGVNVVPKVEVDKNNLTSAIEIATRSFELSVCSNMGANLQVCDVLVTPKEIETHSYYNFSNTEVLFQTGYQSTLEKINEIKQAIQHSNSVI